MSRLRTVVLAFAFLQTVCGQNLPFLHKVEIEAQIQYDATNQVFLYSYVVRNDVSSIGKINRLKVDISRDPTSVQLDTVGLIFKNSFLQQSFQRNYPRLAGRVLPVGFPTLPQYWIGLLTDSGEVSFSGQYVPPGDSVSGLTLSCKGLPAIRRFTAEPEDITSQYPSVDEVSDPDSLIARIMENRRATIYQGHTIGPSAPPSSFVDTTFLNTLVSYKHQAFALGWIKEEGIVTSLDAKLEAARLQIFAGRPSAEQILQSFVNELEALNTRGNLITSEAYALLKFNAEYLLERLK